MNPIISDAVLLPSFKAKLAPVVPLSLQQQLWDEGLMGDYHLLLAHLILQRPLEWRKFYVEHPDCFVIMDNSLIELGKALPPSEILAAATLVHAKALVLPDFLLDVEKTVESSVAAAHKIGWLPAGMKYLAVVQGTTIDEIDTCIKRFIQEIPQLGYISIPRVITGALGSRLPAILTAAAIMQDYGQMYPIHLLGFSDNLADDIKCTAHPYVMGIDSAVCVWSAMKGYKFGTWIGSVDSISLGKRPVDFMEHSHLSERVLKLTTNNLEQFRSWMEEADNKKETSS